jgi:hypothetical protein
MEGTVALQVCLEIYLGIAIVVMVSYVVFQAFTDRYKKTSTPVAEGYIAFACGMLWPIAIPIGIVSLLFVWFRNQFGKR